MDSTTRPRRDELARYVPGVIALVVAGVAVPVGLTRGAPAVVLWLAFAVLAGAVVLFWESVRLVLDPRAPGDEAAVDGEEGIPAELEERKRAALRALRDIEFEHAIHRLGDEDYEALKVRYRAEARAALRAIDEGLGDWLVRADAMLTRSEVPATSTPPAGTPPAGTPPASAPPRKGHERSRRAAATSPEPARANCGRCGTAQDPDAVFCKKCGTRIAEAE